MRRFLALIIITVAVVSCNHAYAMDSHAADRAALLSFRTGVQGNLSGWGSLRMCNWTGVPCDLRGRVISLSTPHRNLTGLILPAIGNLSALEMLDVRGNHLFRSLPPELGLLKRMAYLYLNSKILTGDIPEAIFCNCSSLVDIDLSGNSLSGVIPLPIRCRLPYTEKLSLFDNRLVGVIPPSISNLTSLQDVLLGNNFLGGVLASQMFNKMTYLVHLSLGFNNFSSDGENTNFEPFLASLVNCTSLRHLGLESNGIRGKILPIIGNLTANHIYLYDNRITGTVPHAIGSLRSLIELDLSNNMLRGPIPSEIFHLQWITVLGLLDNQISGEIPRSIGRAQYLNYIDVSYNDLQGAIPETLSNLTELGYIVLGDNRISGKIPKSIGLAEGLYSIDLSYNCLHGVIPDTLFNITDLQHLALNDNQLSGNIAPHLS